MIPLRDENPARRLPVITVVLLVLNIGVYFLVQPRDATETRFTFEYAAVPDEVTSGEPLACGEIADAIGRSTSECATPDEPIFPDKNVWLAVLYSMFLHGSLLHLGGNMLFLWVFGNNIEDRLGHVKYLAFYLLSGLVATLAHVFLQPDSAIPLVGASGAIAGVMGAYLVWFPNVQILTAFFFILIFFRRIAAKWLLGFWFVSQFFINPNEGVAWAAHVGGFVFGALVGLATRGPQPARRVPAPDPYRW